MLVEVSITDTLPEVSPPTAPVVDPIDQLAEIMVEAREPRYVSPTRRDQIGRIWAPVMINGRGPFRLVLDTGATHSAVTALVAMALGVPTDKSPPVIMRGVTGFATVPTIKVESLSVQRDDRPDEARTDDTAPAEINLQLHNERGIVADDNGLGATLRHTFGEGADALFGSVRVIGVLIAPVGLYLRRRLADDAPGSHHHGLQRGVL